MRGLYDDASTIYYPSLPLSAAPLQTISIPTTIDVIGEITIDGSNTIDNPGLKAGLVHLRDKILAVSPPDRVVLIQDSYFREVISEIENTFIEKGLYCKVVELPDGYDPECLPKHARDCFLDPDYPVMVIGTMNNIWHTSERKSAKYKLKKRLVNLIHPTVESVPSLVSDPAQYADNGKFLFSRIRSGKKWRITAPGGTDLTGEFPECSRGFFIENGDYSKGGTGGDFPSGEVGFGPKNGSIKGTIAFDLKVQHIGLTTTPVKIDVDDDRIRVVTTNDASGRYGELIARVPVLSLISEVSFGINPLWSESSDPRSIVEEKNLGTAHFGHGGNTSYGNRTGPHFDAVIREPDLIIDDTLILSRGRTAIQ